MASVILLYLLYISYSYTEYIQSSEKLNMQSVTGIATAFKPVWSAHWNGRSTGRRCLLA